MSRDDFIKELLDYGDSNSEVKIYSIDEDHDLTDPILEYRDGKIVITEATIA